MEVGEGSLCTSPSCGVYRRERSAFLQFVIQVLTCDIRSVNFIIYTFLPKNRLLTPTP